MKGIVFTEFLVMVEKQFDLVMVDKIIEQSDLKSGGAYTSIGTYEFVEMQQLLTRLSVNSNIDPNTLLYEFGKYFYQTLLTNHGAIFDLYKTPNEMLSSIEHHIHVQVKKIYPEAELPTFEVIEEPDQLIMIYKSERAMYAFAHGLMESVYNHFNYEAAISYDLLKEDGTEVKFTIKEWTQTTKK